MRGRVFCLAIAALLVLGGWSERTAVAEEVGLARALADDADPDRFLSELQTGLTRPVVPLSVEDAVAREVLLQATTLSEVDALRTAQALCEEAARQDMDPLLLLALIKVESNFDPYAVSRTGAEGLMQLMPATSARMAQSTGLSRAMGHAFDPVLNVRLGVRYLAELQHTFGGIDLVLTAYNRGTNNTRQLLQQFGGRVPDSVLGVYSEKILRHYDRLKKQYGDLYRS